MSEVKEKRNKLIQSLVSGTHTDRLEALSELDTEITKLCAKKARNPRRINKQLKKVKAKMRRSSPNDHIINELNEVFQELLNEGIYVGQQPQMKKSTTRYYGTLLESIVAEVNNKVQQRLEMKKEAEEKSELVSEIRDRLHDVKRICNEVIRSDVGSETKEGARRARKKATKIRAGVVKIGTKESDFIKKYAKHIGEIESFAEELKEKNKSLTETKHGAKEKQKTGVETKTKEESLSGGDELWVREGWKELVQKHFDAFGQFVPLILGHRGQGKSALGMWLMSNISNEHGLQPCIMGVPANKKDLFPSEIKIISERELSPSVVKNRIPNNSVTVWEEPATTAGARDLSDLAEEMGDVINKSRHGNKSLILVTQKARDVDVKLTSSAVLDIWKRPNIPRERGYGSRWERQELKEEAKIAHEKFSSEFDMDDPDSKKYSYIFYEDGEEWMKNGLPSWWNEEISHLFK